MKRFFEDSSQAKILSKDKSIRCALRYLTQKPELGYELRRYYQVDGKWNHDLLGIYATRKAAEVAKSFKEIQYGENLAIVLTNYFVAHSIDFEMVGG